VLGANGAGKSSLLRIMAGSTTITSARRARRRACASALLAQEPAARSGKTVRERGEEGVGETRALLHRFEEISAKFAEPLDDDEMNALLEEQAKLQDRSTRRRLGARPHARRRDGGAALPAATPTSRALGRRAPPRGAVPAAAPEARPAAARRADQPPRRRVGRVARALPAGVSGHGRRDHARPLLPRQRAEWILELDRGRGIPWKGNYSSWLEQKEQRLALEEKQAARARRTLERELEWIRCRRARARRRARRASRVRALASEEEQRAARRRDRDPARPRLGDVVLECEHLSKGYDGRC
jgi:ATPase subunit of ABC transporter with duplicated ATPase domains